MAEQKMKARDKNVQKMTRDGLVEKNLTEHSERRVSSRQQDVELRRSHTGKGIENMALTLHRSVNTKASGNGAEASGRSRPGDAGRVRSARQNQREQADYSSLRSLRTTALSDSEETTSSAKRKLQQKQMYRLRSDKKHELIESRGDSRRQDNGGAKRPQQKRRLKFAAEETGAAGKKTGTETGRRLSAKMQEEKNRSQSKVSSEKKAAAEKPKEHSRRQKQFNQDTALKKNRRLRFEEAQPDGKISKVNSAMGDAGGAVSSAARRKADQENGDENAAVEGTLHMEEAAEHAARLRNRRKSAYKNGSRRKNRRNGSSNRNGISARHSLSQSSVREEKRRVGGIRQISQQQKQKQLQKYLQKKQIQRDYAKAHRMGESTTTAVTGTIDYIKKVGGKVTDFFKENRKVYLSFAAVLVVAVLLMLSVTSCSSLFLQNLAQYTATGYISSDEAINQAELYYTKLEADLQEKINNMESTNPGYEEYRYNVGAIEHEPFILISYLSAKYEDFTFEQVKPELDALFAAQYNLETEGGTETVTETATVKVGESLGQVVTSGYCNCVICCGIWSGGPTASGVYPTASHTLAVDASDPFVPIGTKVVMNGVEYTVEDTGAFARYGVQFDVYYDSHSAASAHGHQTWECYLADDNGTQEVEVTRTSTVNVLNVTLNSSSLYAVCYSRLNAFGKELFAAYNETKGNLQMFGSPFTFDWYGSVSSYYGYRIHPISGNNQMHNGIDIAASAGTSVSAGLTGTVTEATYNDSYGNYVVIADDKGYELRYAHLESISVASGAAVNKGDEIGKVGSTGNSTGPHLHMEVLKDGERLNPIYYVETGTESVSWGSEYCSAAASALLAEAEKHLGTPYVWGGYSPSGFDCSGFVSYCLTQSGARNTGRLTAQGLYDICTPVSQSDLQPGDLVFFTGTYACGDTVTHVGIYAGNGQMLHCGSPIQYADLFGSSYWMSHLYGFGRW